MHGALRYGRYGDTDGWGRARRELRKFQPGQRLQLTLEHQLPGGGTGGDGENQGSSTPRYSLAVVDRAEPARKQQPLAAFIVPIGREHEWYVASIA